MGTQDSKVIIGTPEEYAIQQQNKRQQQKSTKESQSFFKIQPCYYPHSLMQKQNKSSTDKSHHHHCTRRHDKFHDKYNLCTQCEKEPQKIWRNRKIIYEKNNYEVQRPKAQQYNNNVARYKQKDILAPGPQVPGFYNGFSLPVDKFYKQKAQVSDHIQPIKGSIYREENKEMEQSIYEEKHQRSSHQLRQIEIDYEGFQQNLRF